MSTRSRTIRVAFGLMLLALFTGCQSSSPYGQPGYYGQPTYGMPAGVYQPPAGSYVAPGGAVPGPALQVAPSGGAFISPNSPQARVTQPGGSAPAFDPATDVQPQPGDNLVPEYQDPGSFDPGPADSFENQPKFEDDAGFDEPQPSSGGFDDDAFDDDAFKDAPFEDTSARPAYDDPRVELQGIQPLDGQFEQPIPFQPTSARPRLQETSARAPRPSPYAHDAKSFAWLRGTVDYDETAKTWHVIYSLRPIDGDEFGGTLELAGPPALFASLETGDVVLVEGQLERTETDARGKPRYRVDQIAELVPTN